MQTLLKVLYSVLLGLAGAVGDAGIQYLNSQAVELGEAGLVGLVVAVLARVLGAVMKKVPTKATLGLLCVVLAGYGCTRAEASRIDRVVLIGTGVLQGDSVQLRAGWTAATAPGRPIETYDVRVVRGADTVFTASVADSVREVLFWYPRPAVGTVDTLAALVRGVTDAGTEGAWGESPPTVVATPDAAPLAPDVTLDTVEVSLDSITIHTHSHLARLDKVSGEGFWLEATTSSRLGAPLTDPAIRYPYAVYTDTVRLCAVLWVGERTVDCGCDAIRCATYPVQAMRRDPRSRPYPLRVACAPLPRRHGSARSCTVYGELVHGET